jgi:hypothetical protein
MCNAVALVLLFLLFYLVVVVVDCWFPPYLSILVVDFIVVVVGCWAPMEGLGDGRALDSAQGVYGSNSVYTFNNFTFGDSLTLLYFKIEFLAEAQSLILLLLQIYFTVNTFLVLNADLNVLYQTM